MDLRAHHIVTVGTSIVRKLQSRLAGCTGEGSCPAGLDPGEASELAEWLSSLSRSTSVGALEEASGWSGRHERLLRVLELDPYEASAELNAMRPWLEAGGGLVDRVVLLPTETPQSMLAGRLLREYLANRIGRNRVVIDPVPRFHEGVWPGLLSLSEKARNYIREAITGGRDRVVMLNATGGFKPEAGVLILLGTVYGGDRAFAYYIHEHHRQPTLIPLLSNKSLATRIREAITRALMKHRQSDPVPILPEDPEADRYLQILATLLHPLGLASVEERMEERVVLMSRTVAETISTLI